MAKSKPLTSPKGKFVFPHLTVPDMKFETTFGAYHVKVNTDPKLAQPIIDSITPLMKEALDEAKVSFKEKFNAEKSKAKREKMKKPVQADLPYLVEDDGSVTLSFKMKAGGKNTKTGETFKMQPVLYDAKGNVIDKPIKIGSGTIGKVSYHLNKFYIEGTGQCGVSLRLCAAQIIVLKEWGADAAYHGFESEEDGFDSDELPDAPDDASDDSSDDASDDSSDDSTDGTDADDF